MPDFWNCSSRYFWKMAFQSLEFPSPWNFWCHKKSFNIYLEKNRQFEIFHWKELFWLDFSENKTEQHIKKCPWKPLHWKAVSGAGKPLANHGSQGLYNYKIAIRLCGMEVESPERTCQTGALSSVNSFLPPAKPAIWMKHFRQRWRFLRLLTSGAWIPWVSQLGLQLHGWASLQPQVLIHPFSPTTELVVSRWASCGSSLKMKCFCETFWVQCLHIFQGKTVHLENSCPPFSGGCILSELARNDNRS